MNKFHKSVEFFISHCTICKEAWPLKDDKRRQKVHDALLWLVQNNPHYAELEIDEGALNSLPENGIPADLMTVETENEIISDDNVMTDLSPPTDNPSEDIVL